MGCTQSSIEEQDLVTACRKGDISTVQRLLDQGVDVNVNVKGWAPVTVASFNNHLEIVKLLLLDRNAIVDNPNGSNRSTALQWASNFGHTDVVKLLLDRDANVDFMDYDGDTALINASRAGRKECVKLLLSKGARVDFKNDNLKTALDLAQTEGHIEIVKLLTRGK
jgi:ankyrin repeat protein